MLDEFRNLILTVKDMSDGERFERFGQGPKNKVKLDVLKSQSSNFEDAPKIALRVNRALCLSTLYSNKVTRNKIDPMKNGNVQRRTPRSDDGRRRMYQDIRNNACVVCHTKYCRPYKCLNKKKRNAMNSTEDEDEGSTALDGNTDSEN